MEVKKAPQDLLDKLLEEIPEDDEGELRDQYEEEQRLLCSADHLASLESEVDNWTTWRTEKHLYLCHLAEDDRYALVIRDWEDNWGAWVWDAPYVVSGAPGPEAASAALVKAYVAANLREGDDDLPPRLGPV